MGINRGELNDSPQGSRLSGVNIDSNVGWGLVKCLDGLQDLDLGHVSIDQWSSFVG